MLAALLFAPHDSHLPLQQFSLKSVRQKVYEPISLSSHGKALYFEQ
jgi:hypothetical protein